MSLEATRRFPIDIEGLNDSGSDIAAFLCVQGGPSSIALAAGIDAAVYGVTAADIADDERGDVQIGGVAIVTAGTGGVTEGDLLMPEAGGTGKAVTWAPGAGVNATVLGKCLKTAAADGLSEVYLWASPIGQGA